MSGFSASGWAGFCLFDSFYIQRDGAGDTVYLARAYCDKLFASVLKN